MKNPGKVKLPQEGGLSEARQKLRELKRTSPSSELVKVIDEVTGGENADDQSEETAAPLRTDPKR
jgi:hypothetical protein